MERSFLQTYLEAFHDIEGWFSFDAALLFMAYNEIIAGQGIAGDVLEIGVHHGLSAIATASLRGNGARFYAVDLFEDRQDENVSGSGSGHRAIFERNCRRFYPDSSFVRVIAGPSTTLSAATLGANFSFCHIDGGHSRKETFHDLALCNSLLVPGGLVALDDYYNPRYPGVSEGGVQFMLERQNALRPLAIAYNKVIFQKLPAPGDLNKELVARFPALSHTMVFMWDRPAMLVGEALRSHVDLHASTPERLVRLGEVRRAVMAAACRQLEAGCGQTIMLPVQVTNVSGEAFPAGEGVFGLSYHLLSPAGEILRYDNQRTWLVAPLQPGGSQMVSLAVQAPEQAGSFQLEIDLVWENVMWFKDVGNPTEFVHLSVQPATR